MFYFCIILVRVFSGFFQVSKGGHGGTGRMCPRLQIRQCGYPSLCYQIVLRKNILNFGKDDKICPGLNAVRGLGHGQLLQTSVSGGKQMYDRIYILLLYDTFSWRTILSPVKDTQYTRIVRTKAHLFQLFVKRRSTETS